MTDVSITNTTVTWIPLILYIIREIRAIRFVFAFSISVYKKTAMRKFMAVFIV
jgi:hypothetical protein